MNNTAEGGKKTGIGPRFNIDNIRVGTIHRIATALDNRSRATSPAWLHIQVAAT
jgi:hypothetical protein